jgi:uncharacterized membrane protein YidH (DUF202 family)
MSIEDSTPEDRAAGRVDLRLMNSKIAADSALMAWTNMTISLTSFGFAIYEILHQRQEEGASLPATNAPQYVGLFLILLGTAGISMGIAAYLQRLRQLRALRHFGFAQPVLIMAMLMFGLGMFLIVNIIVRVF